VTEPSDESSLDQGGSDVSRRYRQLPLDGVPTDLDRLILDHARAAVGVPAPRRGWIRWGFPLGLVGSALLAATVMLEGAREPAANPDVAATVAPQVEPMAASTPTEPGESAAVSEPTRAAAPAATPAPSRSEDTAFVSNRPSALTVASESAVLESSAAQLSEPVVEHHATTLPSESPLQTAPATADSPMSPDPAMSTAATETPPAAEPEAGSAFDGLEDLRWSTAPPAKQAAAEERLEDIRYLRQSGRKRAADNAWRKFVQDFPGYPVPAEDIARPRDR